MKAPGEPAKLYMDTTMRILEGDYIRTQTGRTYLVTAVRVQLRGKHEGRQHLQTVVMAKDHEVEKDARVIPIHWYVRRRKVRA